MCIRDRIGEDKKSNTVNFHNIDYKKGPTYSLSMRPQAITYCQSNMQKQLNSIIVESDHFITVWSQLKNSSISPNVDVDTSQENNNQSTSNHSPESVQKIPTKKIMRRYRGQIYEVEVLDYEAMKNNQSQKPARRKKYRGQYID